MPFVSRPDGTVQYAGEFDGVFATDPPVIFVEPSEFHTSTSTRTCPPSGSREEPDRVGVVVFVSTIAGLPPHCAEHGLVNRPATVPG